MKILIIRSYPSYMDVEKKTYNIQELGLAKALVRKGHICDIVFWTNKEEKIVDIKFDDDKSVKVYYYKGKTFLKNSILNIPESLLEQYDILQIAEYNQIQSWIFAKKYPNKTIIYHGPYYSKFNWKYNLMCKIFDIFCLRRYKKYNTRFMTKSKLAEDFLLKKGIKKENITCVGVGLDEDFLLNTDSKETPLSNQMEQDKEKLKLLYIGKIEKRRNTIFLIKLFNEVQKHIPDSRLYIVGNGKDKYMKKIYNLISKYNLKDKIYHENKIEQKEISKIYKKSDIFLFPTNYDIFGMVLLEALYFENIVISTLNGGSISLVKNDINGFIVNELDVKRWTKVILEISRKLIAYKTNMKKLENNNLLWDKIVENITCMFKGKGEWYE